MQVSSISPGLRHELALLVLSRYPLIVVESADESKVRRLARQVAADLGQPLLEWSSTTGLARRGAGGVHDTRDPDRALARALEMRTDCMVLFHDLHPYFDRPEVVRRLREAESANVDRRISVLLAGLQVELPPELRTLSARISISLPDEKELGRLVRATARELGAQRRTRVDLTNATCDEMARALLGLHLQEARRVLYQAALADGVLDADDVPAVRREAQLRLQATSELEWIEPVSGLDTVGGLPEFKSWVQRRAEAFSAAAKLFGVDEPRGVLLVGVPGTGKSLACRALAGEWSLPLLRLDPGRLYQKYVGETEANLRRALFSVEALAPAVLWVDEIEKALATGTGHADDGLSQRVLRTLLTWMQERQAPVFVMATSNDVSRLPVEILRRGRFDDVFFVDLPSPAERRVIFSIHLDRRGREPGRYDLDGLAALTEGFSGAEIEAVVVAALHHAFSDRQELSDRVLVAEIEAARPLSRLRPREIERLRDWGERHARPA